MNDGYDYFGARYYDNRIGRWGQVEPLLDKYVGITPYCYSLNNSIGLVDEDGNRPRQGQQWIWAKSPNEQIKEGLNALKERVNSALENFSNGNIGMGILETATLPTLSLAIIPSTPMMDLISPIGMVKGLSSTTKLVQSDKKVVEFAKNLSELQGGKSAINIGYGELHLIGDAHKVYSNNVLVKSIETPHVHMFKFNQNPLTGKIFPHKQDIPVPAIKDVQKGAKVIFKRIFEGMQKTLK